MPLINVIICFSNYIKLLHRLTESIIRLKLFTSS
uniref:Uncharacterized protein n=1 Tax=Anguilla anguilla TaxID=7936 RepID=A0A0E9S9M7_ANGAN